MEYRAIIRTFCGDRFNVHIADRAEGTFGLWVEFADIPVDGEQGYGMAPNKCLSTVEAFELSRLFKLAGSFIEWIQEYGVAAADDWSGQAPHPSQRN